MIDTSKIEGFDTMSAEEKVNALLGLDDGTETEKKYKELISKANSETKKYKDMAREAQEKLNSQMTEDELKRAEEQKRIEDIEKENAMLKRDATIARKTAFYTSLGFDSELAKATAEAFADGDFETVEANQLKAHQEFEKNIRADVIRQNPHPANVGSGTSAITKKDIMSIRDSTKRQQMIAEHPELFGR